MKGLAIAGLVGLSLLFPDAHASDKDFPWDPNGSNGAKPLEGKAPKSPWVIPLTEYWKDPLHFVLVIPQKGVGTKLYKDIKSRQLATTVYDTLQGIIMNAQGKGEEYNCELYEYYDVVLGPKKKRGWLASPDVYTIGQLDLGTFKVGGRILRLGEMKNVFRNSDDYCSSIRPLFFYDDSFLYLIDIAGMDPEEFSLRWKEEQHISLVDFPPGISLQGETEEERFVMNWGVPNGAATLILEFKDDHPKFNFFEMRPVEGDFEEGLEEESDQPQTITCVFQDASMGDCFYLEFDCSDFGSAKTQLTPEEETLWRSLTIQGKDGVTGNPKYKGKAFEITYQMTEGHVCGNPSTPAEPSMVELIISFKVK